MNNISTIHIPVLKNEVLDYLSLDSNSWVVDATLGLGGHAEEILKIIKKGFLIGIDQDEESLKLARERLRGFKNVIYILGNFENLTDCSLIAFSRTYPPQAPELSLKKGQSPEINAILFDLGLSSFQLEDSSRGFSFQKQGPLDMRFDKNRELRASDIINKWPYEKLIYIFKNYGEEKYSKLIADAILKFRKTKHLDTTKELADLIARIVYRREHKHPATRVFQALRIAVNNELLALENGLKQAIEIIAPKGRIAVISYHSLEDRIVKNLFRNYSRGEKPVLRILTKKPITPTQEEIIKNPRARSAKLRAVEKL